MYGDKFRCRKPFLQQLTPQEILAENIFSESVFINICDLFVKQFDQLCQNILAPDVRLDEKETIYWKCSLRI